MSGRIVIVLADTCGACVATKKSGAINKLRDNQEIREYGRLQLVEMPTMNTKSLEKTDMKIIAQHIKYYPSMFFVSGDNVIQLPHPSEEENILRFLKNLKNSKPELFTN